MSFFKKLTDEFKELKANFEDKPKDESKPADSKPHEGTREGGYGGGPDYPHQQSAYGQPQQQQYGQHQYSAPPPSQHSGPQGQPPLPPGWNAQFDQNSQRWYYVEQATGRTQWEPPAQHNYGGYGAPPPPPQSGYGAPGPHSGYGSPHPPGGYSGERGHGEPGGFYNQYGGAMPAQGHSEQQHQQNAARYYGDAEKAEKKGKSNDMRNMLLAAGAGLAVGGLAGAALADDSDDEHHAAPPAAYGGGGGDPYAYGAPPPPAAHDSDAESLHEAQQDYNEAVEAAADSDASSDELEDLQEAREELEEEQEEYDED